MSAHSKTGRPFSAVEGGDGDTEVFGEFLHIDEPVRVFHARDDPSAPSQITLIHPPSR
jgi:hypothetical protein